MNYLESAWKEYRDACYAGSVGKLDPLQEVETRQAFFAGCLVALMRVKNVAQDSQGEDAFKEFCALLTEAQTVRVQRCYEVKGRN